MAIFTLGSLGCALSHSLPLLIAMRVLQGFGGAAIMSMNGALVRHTYPDAHLGRGLGLNGRWSAIAAAVAPSLASGILAVGPWPWLFAVNVPFGLLNLWLAGYLPRSESSARGSTGRARSQRGDVRALLRRDRRADPRRRRLAGGGRAPGRGRRRRGPGPPRRAGPAPLIPLDLFRDPVFSLSVTASICAFAAFAITFVALPFHFQSVLGPTRWRPGC